MKCIEIELEEDGNSQEVRSSRRRTFSNLKGRKVLLTPAGIRCSSVVKINSADKNGLSVSYPLGSFSSMFHRNERTEIIPYENIQRAVLLNPKVGDDMITRAGYAPVTERTITETVKWAQRGYLA